IGCLKQYPKVMRAKFFIRDDFLENRSHQYSEGDGKHYCYLTSPVLIDTRTFRRVFNELP
uniref:Uncharacterized protein n=1 Tax=Astatotilapia calliptera TaxID=8154 RepID=A0A3P8QAQ1_ASTCA